jgi:hypothetical protein
MREFLGEDKLKEFINFVLAYLCVCACLRGRGGGMWRGGIGGTIGPGMPP